MKLTQNESSRGRAARRAEPSSIVDGDVKHPPLCELTDSPKQSSKHNRGIFIATAIVLSLLFAGIAGSVWAGEGKPVVQKPASGTHAAVKEIKLHKRRKTHSRASRSHHYHRSRKHRTRARVAHAQPRVERVHAVRRHSHHVAVKPITETHIAAVPEIPAPPPLPDWPANNKPAAAAVNWNGRELRIDARNSSLNQILADVSTATGVKVEGQSGDQRVYGSYGPAPARDVLNQLLDGSDYNILMVGDSGDGTPRELVLSRKVKMVASNRRSDLSGAASDDDDDGDADQPEPAEPIRRRPFPGQQPPQGGAPGTPTSPQEQQMQFQQMQLQMQRRLMPAGSSQPEEQPNQ